MINKLMNLEDKILNNQTHLIEHYPNTKVVLSQIDMILNYGMNSDKISEWLRLNKIAINIIDNILEKKNDEFQKKTI